MGRPRLLWQIAAPMAALVVVAVVGTTWQAFHVLGDFHLRQIALDLEAKAALVDEVLGAAMASGSNRQVAAESTRIGQLASMRVTVIAPDGKVLGESERDPALLDNHGSRPEFVAALTSGNGAGVRYSDTVEEHMMYAARAVRRDGKILGAVRVGLPLAALAASRRDLFARAALAALLVAGLTLAVGFLVARRVTRPLEELEILADRYMAGEVTAPLPTEGSAESLRVGEAMHRLAAELDSRISALVAERNEQQAVLASMVEGVLAVDGNERLMALNAAGANLLGVDRDQAIGRSIQEVARNAELQRFVAEALVAKAPIERDVVLLGEEQRFLQAHGAPVRDHARRRIGAVVVLNDVTRLRRLETVRRDFVANVSHELKTPVTSIKGFLETLLGGAMNDPANAKRFLEIASRQADRLGAIIEDLLILSRIDQDSDQPAIERTPTAIEPVVRGAVDVCRMKADERGIEIRTTCQPGLSARINGALVEQALVNLLDNAIKYSEAGSAVEVDAAAVEGAVTIRVRDTGPGVEAEHLPRLFERFYRVDRARSRALGGTGLGLAIVKHIAQAQGGSVLVESRPGAGSTFTLRFPTA
jgi:two-component system phosphate regulon sensor histidine kinase PhoR